MQADPIERLAPRRLVIGRIKIIVANLRFVKLIFLSNYLISCVRWAVILAPDAANGWPNAIAPPVEFKNFKLITQIL